MSSRGCEGQGKGGGGGGKDRDEVRGEKYAGRTGRDVHEKVRRALAVGDVAQLVLHCISSSAIQLLCALHHAPPRPHCSVSDRTAALPVLYTELPGGCVMPCLLPVLMITLGFSCCDLCVRGSETLSMRVRMPPSAAAHMTGANTWHPFSTPLKLTSIE